MMPDEHEAPDQNTTHRHTETMVGQWNAAGKPPSGMILSFDEESMTIAVGFIGRRGEGIANLTLAYIDIDDAIGIRDELGNYIDFAILARYRDQTSGNGDD